MNLLFIGESQPTDGASLSRLEAGIPAAGPAEGHRMLATIADLEASQSVGGDQGSALPFERNLRGGVGILLAGIH